MPSSADILARAVRYHQAGSFQQAEQNYRQVLQAEPAQPDAVHLLGVLAWQTGRAALAREYLERAVAIAPSNPAYHASLGLVYQQLGKLDEAAAAYREALRLQPDSADTHRSLGLTLAARGRLDEAAASYQEALRLRPDFAEVCNDLGIVRKNQGRLDEAVGHYRQAVRLRPGLADAHNNLGNALKIQGRLDEAVASCREALRLRPDHAAAHNNLGNALADLGRIDEAIASYREALRVQPNMAQAHSNLLLCLNYTDKVDPTSVFAEHRRWASLHEPAILPRVSHANDRTPDRVLRVGYVSPDLRNHPTVRFLEPILSHHDRTRVQMFCYAEVPAPDAVTRRLQALVHAWRSTCGLSDAQVADQVRRDGIDVLVDLAGHTAGNRLLVFTHRPAPVQVTYMGYPNTTGLRSIDYRLGDAVMDPAGSEALNSEQLVRLPRGVVCFAAPTDAPAVNPLPARSSGVVTLGSLHKLSKLNSAVLELWCRILQAVPTARLLIFRNTLVGKAKEELARQFEERGIDPGRLDLRHAAQGSHLTVYGDIDLALDTFPYGGGTTSCEALWMGVPFPTLRGDRPAARTGAMLLDAVGLPELIADTLDEYVRKAVELATDLDRLAGLRASLRERMRATLGDGLAFTRSLEDVYRTLWRSWCARST